MVWEVALGVGVAPAVGWEAVWVAEEAWAVVRGSEVEEVLELA